MGGWGFGQSAPFNSQGDDAGGLECYVCTLLRPLQVIIFYEVSPLVRIVSSRKVRSAVVMGVMKMLSSRPEQKIRLLE